MKKRIFSLITVFAMIISIVYSATTIEAMQNRVWVTNNQQEDITTIEKGTGEWQDIKIDATVGKFAPRDTDLQINPGTILSIPVSGNELGANIILNLSGGSCEVVVDNQTYTNSSNKVTIPVTNTSDTMVDVTFKIQSYISSIELSYTQPEAEYPGVPEGIEASDKEYYFNTLDSLKDENGNVQENANLEGVKGSYDDILVDARNGKFNIQVDQNRVAINPGTTIYVPVTTDSKGVSLVIAGTIDGSTPIDLTVDGKVANSNSNIALTVDDTKYVTVTFNSKAYVSMIKVDYGSDSGYGVPEVTAKDKSWDFTGTSSITRPDLQFEKGEFDGIQIDASTSKFAPRENDTQINGGTILYLPIAADSEIALTVSGNNYNNLDVEFNGQPISIGAETVFKADETSYLPLTFTGTGSCYLDGIVIDYSSDNASVSHTVRVGTSSLANYSSIQSALDNEVSSAATPLIIELENGVYNEKISVNQPNVTLKSISGNSDDVIIQSNYYSSNTFDDKGNFIPQDEKDVGTDQSGTIIVGPKGTNFSMYNITVENTYNTKDNTGKDQQTPAVALCINADKVLVNKCKIIGRQDTLYVKGPNNRIYFKDTYIEGTVDFIFGNADAYFEQCNLHMAYFNGKDNGYYTAPNTNEDNQGLVFNQCRLTADSRVEDVSLGRPWQNECYTESIRVDGSTLVTYYDPEKPNPDYEHIASSSVFIDCYMTNQIQNERWNVWTRKYVDGSTVNVTYEDTVEFIEYNSMDLDGNLLSPDDYDIVLGKMEHVDSKTKIEEILNRMRIGNSLGQWLPEIIPDDNPGVVTPPEQTTDDENQAGNNQSSSSTSTSQSVKTGDTAQITILVAGTIIALCGIFVTSKRRSKI